MKIVLSVVAVIVGLVFGVHALTYVAARPAGACSASSRTSCSARLPSLTVQLECALSTPSAPAAPLPQCSDPADVNPIGCTQPPSPPPRPSPSCLQTNIGCLQTPAALRPGPLPPGATFPAGYPNVACANGKTYLDQNGHGTLSSERAEACTPGVDE